MLDEIKNLVQQHDNLVAKDISTSQVNNGASSLTSRQDLSPVLTKLSNRRTPLRDMARREKGSGATFTFNLRSSLYSPTDNTNPREMFYADGGLPTTKTPAYTTVNNPYKAVGHAGGVTGLAEAQMESFIDLYAEAVESTMRTVIQAEEWLLFWSDTTTTNTAGLTGFSGLDALITTNVVDAGGAAISKAHFDQASNLIAQRGGGGDNMMAFAPLAIGANINNLFNPYAQVIINGSDRQALTLGNKIRDISTVAGPMSIVYDFFLNPGNTYPLSNGTSSYPTGATTGTIFIVNMDYFQVRVLKELGMEELGRVADKRQFIVNEYITPVLTAEPWCAKIKNVSTTITG